MQRRSLLQAASAVLTLSATASLLVHAADLPTLAVWKSPTCGCCKDWVAHMQASGFRVTVHEVDEATKSALRQRLGLADKYGSCHTAQVDGYVIEGHVPASDVKRLLKERPKAVGLAAPGMPIGSPGMDGPAYGGRQDAYAVLLVQKDGSSRVFQAH